MFTGIVSGLGRIVEAHPAPLGKRLVVEAPAGYLDDVQAGDSIAINGACMTVIGFDAAASRFSLDISAESLQRTAGLGALRAVNLEKALRATDRLGGHLVSGHVDGVADTADGCDFTINLIPHTLQQTTLAGLAPGHRVNLEVDLIARYVERMLNADQPTS